MSLADLDKEQKKVLMFGGKGGVGKSTISSATAVHFALSGKKTLLISTDLTPSLSDIFETSFGPTERPVPGIERLYALEIGMEEVMRKWKEKFGSQIYQVASAVVDMPYDELIDYVGMAPGIQEEFMLDFIMDYIRGDRYDTIVWDTAPAGDTLRLLALPGKFLNHLRTAPRFYFRAQELLGISKAPFLALIGQWTALSEEIVQFFTKPANVEFLIVTIPEALGVFQSRRVMRDLAENGLVVRRMIINCVITEPDSEFMRSRYWMQQKYIRSLKDEFGACSLTMAPLLSSEIRGLAKIREIEAILFTQ